MLLEDEESKGNFVDYSRVIDGELPEIIPDNQSDEIPPKIEEKKTEIKNYNPFNKPNETVQVKQKELVINNNPTIEVKKPAENTLFSYNPFDSEDDPFSSSASNESKLF